MPTGRTAFQRKPPLYGHYAAIRQTGEQFMDQATLMDKIKTGTTLCKAIMRNGYDAYAINAPLQGLIFEKTGVFDVDIACACDTETLFKIFPNAVPYTEEGAMAMLQENGVTLRFYSTDVEDASHPEMSQLRITPRLARLLAELQLKGQLKSSNTNDPEAKEFEDFDKAGSVKLVGLPSKTLAKNYLLAPCPALRGELRFARQPAHVGEHHPVRQPYPRLRTCPRNHGRMAQGRRRIHVEVRAAPL